MPQQIPEELRNKLAQFQTLQQQLQMMVVEKQRRVLENGELEEASKELRTSKGDVYKSVGPLLIKSSKANLDNEIKERISSAESSVKLLESQEQKLTTKLQELQKNLQSSLAGIQDVPGAAQ